MRRYVAAVVVCALCAAAAAAEQKPDRLKHATSLIFAGRMAEARALLREAQEAYATEPDAQHEGVCSLLLAITDLSLDPAAARADLQSAAAKFESAGDRYGDWFALSLLAQFEYSQGQFNDAVQIYEKSLAALTKAGEATEPFSLEAFRTFALMFGAAAENLDIVVTQPALARESLLPFAEGMTRDKYAEPLMELGELQRADAELKRASSLSAMCGGMFDASINVHMGDLRRRQWRLDEARERFMKALAGAKMLPQLPGSQWTEVDILGRLAELEIVSGNTDEALAWNDKSLGLVRVSGDAKREASLLQKRARILVDCSRFGAAETTWSEAMKIAETLGDVHRQASIEMDLGTLDFSRRAYGQSAARLEEAIALFQRGDAEFPRVDAQYEETLVWALLAEDYLFLDAPETADGVLKKGRALAERSKSSLAVLVMDVVAIVRLDYTQQVPRQTLERLLALEGAKGLAFNDYADALLRAIAGGIDSLPGMMKGTNGLSNVAALTDYLKGQGEYGRGDVAAARRRFLTGLEKNRSGDVHAGYLAAIALTYASEGNDDEAILYLSKAVETIENAVSDVKAGELLAGYLGGDRRLYFDWLIEFLVRNGRTKEAFDYAERARARAFLQLVGSGRLSANRAADSSLVREAEELRRRIAALEVAVSKPDEAGTALEKTRKEYEGLLPRLKVSSPEYASLTRIDTLPVEAIQKELPAGTTLISYFTSPFGVYAWVIVRDAFQYVPLRAGREALHAALCWADGYERTGDPTRSTESLQNPCSGRTATAEEVFERFIAPLRPKIRNTRLILIPHGQLHYIPFAALRDPGTGRYLVEDYVLTYAPSASTLRFFHAKPASGQREVLILGDPETPDSVPDLPGASCEAVSMAGALGIIPLLGAKAKESALHHLDHKIRLLHIGAHASYNSASPLFSRVLLAPGDDHDGNLEVHEILSDLDLQGVDLIVLSACRTAIGERSGGDEIVGLTRALLYAGSSGVISTLWDISDQASAEVMEEFYKRLLAGAPAADALRGAQIAMLTSFDHSDPKYWAAFNLTGDPQVRWDSAP